MSSHVPHRPMNPPPGGLTPSRNTSTASMTPSSSHRLHITVHLLESRLASAEEESDRLREELRRTTDRLRDSESRCVQFEERFRGQQQNSQQQNGELQATNDRLRQESVAKEESHGRELRQARSSSRELEKQISELRATVENLQEINHNQSKIIDNQQMGHRQEEERMRQMTEKRVQESDRVRNEAKKKVDELMSVCRMHSQRLDGWQAESDVRVAETCRMCVVSSDSLVRSLNSSLEKLEKSQKLLQVLQDIEEKSSGGLLDEFSTLLRQFSETEQELRAKRQEVYELKTDNAALSREKEASLQERDSVREDLEKLTQHNETLAEEMEVRVRENELRREEARTQYEDMNNRLRSDLERIKSSDETKSDRIAELQERVRILEAENGKLSEVNQATELKIEMEEQNKRVETVKREEEMNRIALELRSREEDLRKFTDDWKEEKFHKDEENRLLKLRVKDTEAKLSETEQGLNNSNTEWRKYEHELVQQLNTLKEDLRVQQEMFAEEMGAMRKSKEEKSNEVRALLEQLELLRRNFEVAKREVDEVTRKSEEIQLVAKRADHEQSLTSRKALVFEEELKDVKVSLEQVTSEKDKLSTRVRDLERELSKKDTNTRQTIQSLESQLERSKAECTEAQGLLNVVQDHRKTLHEELEKGRNENDEVERRLRTELDNYKAELQRSKISVSTAQREAENKDRELRLMKEETESIRSDNVQIRSHFDGATEETRKRLTELEDENRQLRGAQSSCERAFEVKRKEVERLVVDAEEANAHISALTNQLEALSRQVSLEGEERKARETLSDRVQDLLSELNTLRSDNERLNTIYSSAVNERDRQKRAHERTVQELRDVNSQLAGQLKQTQAMLIMSHRDGSR